MFFNPMKDRKKNLTREQVKEMEVQGSDVSELWSYVEINERKEESKILARFSMEEIPAEDLISPTDLSSIAPLLLHPKDKSNKLICDTIGKPPLLFGKGKWADKAERAELLLGSVVQCHPALWNHIDEDLTPAAIVIAYSLHPETRNDIAFLKKISAGLNEFRDMDKLNKKTYSKETRKLHKELNDPRGTFHLALTEEVLAMMDIHTPDAQIYVAVVFAYDKKNFPHGALPSDGILPFLQTHTIENDKINFSYACRPIPGSYYQV